MFLSQVLASLGLILVLSGEVSWVKYAAIDGVACQEMGTPNPKNYHFLLMLSSRAANVSAQGGFVPGNAQKT